MKNYIVFLLVFASLQICILAGSNINPFLGYTPTNDPTASGSNILPTSAAMQGAIQSGSGAYAAQTALGTTGTTAAAGNDVRILYDPKIVAMAPIGWWEAVDISATNNQSMTNYSWVDRSGSIGTITPRAGNTAWTYLSGGVNGRPCVYATMAGSAKPWVSSTSSPYFSGTLTQFTVAIVGQHWTTFNNIYDYCTLGTGTSSGVYTALQSGSSTSVTGLNQIYDITSPGGIICSKHRYIATRNNVNIAVFKQIGTSGTGSMQHFVDGVQVVNYFSFYGQAPTVGSFTVGDAWGGGAFTSWLSAVLVWNRALTPSEIRYLNSYLENKYNTHDRPRVYMIGDSITEGYQATLGNEPANLIQAALPLVTVENSALAGTYLHQWAGLPITYLFPYTEFFGGIRTGDVGYIWLGANDLGGTYAQTAAQMITDATTLITAIHQQGGKAVLSTLIPYYSTSQSTTDTKKSTFNAWVLSGTSGADVICDPCSIPPLTSSTAFGSSYYNDAPNGVHLNASGSQLIKPAMVYAIAKAAGIASSYVLTGTLTSGTATLVDYNIGNNDLVTIKPTSVGATSGIISETHVSGTLSVTSSSATDAAAFQVIVRNQ